MEYLAGAGIGLVTTVVNSNGGELLTARTRSLQRGAFVMITLLGIQFLLGMFVNLFGTFPNTSEVLPALEFTVDLPLTAHMAVAFLLQASAITVAVLAFRRPLTRPTAYLALGGVAAIFWAFESGIEFVLSGFTNNAASFSMAVAFFAAVTIYGDILLLTAKDAGYTAFAGFGSRGRSPAVIK